MNKTESIKYVLEKMIYDNDTPCLQYIILNADSIIFEFNDGFSDLESKKQITYTTTFNAFSVTKTFTAVAILQLAEQGKLKLDDDVKLYIDTLPYNKNISIHQLLNHTGGLPNPMPLKWVHLYNEHDKFDSKQFFYKIIDDHDELKYAPGEKFSYSNIGYLLLGEIIEKVSGKDYRAYIKENIIDKLFLTNGAYLGYTIQDTANHAHGYIKKWSFLNFGLNFILDKDKYIEGTYNGWNQFKYYYMNGYPFGGLIGNARGFAQYLKTFINDSVLLKNEWKNKLFEIQNTNNGDIIDMCLGWFRGKLGNNNYYAHAGGGGGYYCEIRIYPRRKIASVIMLNRTGVSDERFLDNVDKNFLND